MKKLFFVSLVFLGMLSLASCKKTVQPSAFTPDTASYSASFIGAVQYKASGANIPAGGDCTTVTAQLMNGTTPVKDWTFSVSPDASSRFGLTVPMKKGAEKNQKYTIKATVKNPNGLEATFEGSVTVDSVNSGQTKDVGTIVCTEVE
ncbi:MAG: hypothetical protein J6X69_03090 [Bacteroidales bacterium]|nr:hypothetical protein [Bacteroidales bacterium]